MPFKIKIVALSSIDLASAVPFLNCAIFFGLVTSLPSNCSNPLRCQTINISVTFNFDYLTLETTSLCIVYLLHILLSEGYAYLNI